MSKTKAANCKFDESIAFDSDKPLNDVLPETGLIPETVLKSQIVAPLFDKDKIVNIEELCEKLNCPQLTFQIEKLTAAKDQLARIQHRELFDRIFGSDYLCYQINNIIFKPDFGLISQMANDGEEICEEDRLICFTSEAEPMELLPENEWHGFFKGYNVLTEENEFSLNDLKKCVEIGNYDTVERLETFLRAGVRCFIIDLFKGNIHSNQTLVVRFRQSELNVAKEMGFPVTSTLFARLSPRLQYTGYLDPPLEYIELHKHDLVTLTTDRYWATHCSNRRIYVNARYLLIDTRRCDILLIGTEIQVQVYRIMDDALRCEVIQGGKLYSRMPVLFHKRCQRFRISLSELEDITFVREVEINVIVSDMIGTEAYFNNLRESLHLLKCENMRIFARFVINNIDDDATDLMWAKDAYDGFLGETKRFNDGCSGDGNFDEFLSPRILFLSQQTRELIKGIHRSRKPLILDPTLLAENHYIMDPASYKHILYHPDKYVFQSNFSDQIGSFFLLANALAENMPQAELNTLMPYCDYSHTGSDSLALATVSASFEINASCIFVLGITGRMVAKIACFRPKATIYFITALKSASNYISIYHNVVMLYYNANETKSYQKSVFREFLYGLSYAIALKALHHEDHVLFVYSQKEGQLFPDKYIAYKFDSVNFVKELSRILF